MEEKRDENSRIIWDCGSPLYDSYEIASVGNLIERNMMMILPSPCESPKPFAVRSNELRSDEGSTVKMEAALPEVGFFSKFVGRTLWKRKTTAVQERNKKAKKLRRVFNSFCTAVWSMQKKKL